jgi:hypothetical protein
MTTAEIQQLIYNETGIKTSAKKLTGSMKNYIRISPMFQNGKYPTFPFGFTQEMQAQHAGQEPNPNFFSIDGFSIYGLTTENTVQYKKECKPKEIEELNAPTWKGQQWRLDKKCQRFAKRAKQGNCVRYN